MVAIAVQRESDLQRLAGSKAIVTGGTSGIGEVIARLFAAEGAEVVVAGRRRDLGEAVASSIAKSGGKAFFVQADIADSRSVQELVTWSVAWMGGVDVLVNNAGVQTQTFLENLSEEDWDRIMDTNAKGAFLCSKAVIPHMRKGGGSIINIGSVGGLRGYPGGAAYAASKAALVLLTKVMALENGRDGIRVNCVAPGSIETPMWRGRVTEEIRKLIVKGVPLGRIGTPEDVARLAVFLASEESSYITGSVMVVDGGISAGQTVY